KVSRSVSALLEDEIPRESSETLDRLSQKFKEACKEFEEKDQRQAKPHPAAAFVKAEASKTTDALRRAADGIGKRLADSASQLLDGRSFETKSPERFKKIESSDVAEQKPAKNEVRKVQFPRI